MRSSHAYLSRRAVPETASFTVRSIRRVQTRFLDVFARYLTPAQRDEWRAALELQSSALRPQPEVKRA
jgi:hypothetical protein